LGPLRTKNFLVGVGPASVDDEQLPALLAHRVFVTNHTEEFREQAAIHEFAIIDVGTDTGDPDKLADIISRGWSMGTLSRRALYVA